MRVVSHDLSGPYAKPLPRHEKLFGRSLRMDPRPSPSPMKNWWIPDLYCMGKSQVMNVKAHAYSPWCAGSNTMRQGGAPTRTEQGPNAATFEGQGDRPGAHVEINIGQALVQEHNQGLSDDHERNHRVKHRSLGIQSQLPQRGRSLKISSRRRGGSITTVSSSDKWKLLAKTKMAHLTSDKKMLKDELQNNRLILDKTADLAVAEINYHPAHGVCCFAPRDPAVEALRRASGSAWKGGGCVQWTGMSMGKSGRGEEEKKCCERR
ncbi:hypothetical protein JB92DRAFT_3097787 [Gautieria morchelliformis]|nr:hypothetical protein JB92DRAFT_3097787 [Gautieria morchelliformis]